MVFVLRTATSRLTLSEAVLSSPGYPVDLGAAWAAVVTPRLCRHGPRLAATVAVTVEDLRVSTAAVAVVVSVAASEVAVGSDERALVDGTTETASAHLAAHLPVPASIVETGTDTSPVVGMIATADAHLRTDVTTDVTIAVVAVMAVDSGTVTTTDAPGATWNPSAAAARVVVGTAIVSVTATATTTVLLGTTAESEATRVAATTNHAKSAATNKSDTHTSAATKPRRLDIWWVVRSPSTSFLARLRPEFRKRVSRTYEAFAYNLYISEARPLAETRLLPRPHQAPPEAIRIDSHRAHAHPLDSTRSAASHFLWSA